MNSTDGVVGSSAPFDLGLAIAAGTGVEGLLGVETAGLALAMLRTAGAAGAEAPGLALAVDPTVVQPGADEGLDVSMRFIQWNLR